MHIQYRFLALLLALGILTACSSGSSGLPGSLGSESTDYPHLLSKPQVDFSQNLYTSGEYDVTVTLEASGPAGVYSATLWIMSEDDNEFQFLDLQFIGGNTWTATTNEFISMPPGNYYIESIILEDADPFANGLVRSSWYTSLFYSDSRYVVDQRLTDYDLQNFSIVEYNLATSNTTIAKFTLP